MLTVAVAVYAVPVYGKGPAPKLTVVVVGVSVGGAETRLGSPPLAMYELYVSKRNFPPAKPPPSKMMNDRVASPASVTEYLVFDAVASLGWTPTS